MAGGKSKTAVYVIVVVILLVLLALVLQRRRRTVSGGAEGKTRPYLMLPAGRGPHTHMVNLDAAGAGTSTEDEGHRHAVRRGVDVGIVEDGAIVPGSHVHSVAEFVA